MKEFITPILTVIAVCAFIIGSITLLEKAIDAEKKTYQVTVIYCDSRPPKRIWVKSAAEPNSSMIRTYKHAAPVFGGQINVCEIQDVKLTNY